MLTVSNLVWSETIAHFRRCGAGRRECVTYWTGPIAQPAVIDRSVHPTHSAGPGSYELDERWLHEFWVDLASAGRCVRVQLHTHGFEAFHSRTDDLWPIVHTPGFLSIVIPNFGVTFSRREIFACEIGDAGQWQQVALDDRVRGIP
jgi:hypothetical protein